MRDLTVVCREVINQGLAELGIIKETKREELVFPTWRLSPHRPRCT